LLRKLITIYNISISNCPRSKYRLIFLAAGVCKRCVFFNYLKPFLSWVCVCCSIEELARISGKNKLFHQASDFALSFFCRSKRWLTPIELICVAFMQGKFVIYLIDSSLMYTLKWFWSPRKLYVYNLLVKVNCVSTTLWSLSDSMFFKIAFRRKLQKIWDSFLGEGYCLLFNKTEYILLVTACTGPRWQMLSVTRSTTPSLR